MFSKPNQMKILSTYFITFLLLINLGYSQVDSIYNINISQRTNGTEIVDIYYNLAGPEYSYNIELEVSFDDGLSFLAIDSIAGDTGIGVPPGFDEKIKHAIWYAGKEYPGEFFTNTQIKIIANREYITCGVSKFYHEGFEYGTIEYEGRCWLDRNLGASRVAHAEDDELSYGWYYQWGRLTDGHQLPDSEIETDLSIGDVPGHNRFIVSPSAPYDWRDPQNTNLWQGVDGINNPCPNGFAVPTNDDWVDASVHWNNAKGTKDYYYPHTCALKLPTTYGRYHINGTFVEYYSGYWSRSISGTRSLNLWIDQLNYPNFNSNERATGNSVRCILETSIPEKPENPAPDSSSIDVIEFIELSWTHSDPSAVFDVYLGTDTLPQLVGYHLTELSFDPSDLEYLTKYYWRVVAINSNGNAVSSNLWDFTSRDFVCGSSIVKHHSEIFQTVEHNERCWLRRNLGADTIAGSVGDFLGFGDYYQWGRLKDGHEISTSNTSLNTSNSDIPNHDLFILSNNNPYNWRVPQNDLLWQGLDAINNPCPEGWHVPTIDEWIIASQLWEGRMDAFLSDLHLPSAGYRYGNTGNMGGQPYEGAYWSKSIFTNNSKFLYFNADTISIQDVNRVNGYQIRCIKNEFIIIPNNPEPANETLINTNAPILKWSCNDPDGDELQYDVFFGLDSLPPLVVSGITDTLYDPGVLEYNQDFYWRVVAKDLDGETSESELWKFTIGGFTCGTSLIEHNGLVYGTVDFVGQCWLDRNLGATQVATAIDDTLSYGYYYQNGRPEDGHEYPYSEVTDYFASSCTPGDSDFIVANPSIHPYHGEWYLGSGLACEWTLVSNPCPMGWKIPETDVWFYVVNSLPTPATPNDHFNLPIKISYGGYRNGLTWFWQIGGDLYNRNTSAHYWTAGSSGIDAFKFHEYTTGGSTEFSVEGLSIRCIKQDWQNDWECGDDLIDFRNNEVYNTKQIGSQCWMSENINIGTNINGTNSQTDNGVLEKHCYNNAEANCSTYGGLYQWGEMMQYVTIEGVQGICPDGWHIPSDNEWCELTQHVDATVGCASLGWNGTDVGTKMKSIDGWNSNGNGNNESGFNALPGGNRIGGFGQVGEFALFWSSTERYSDFSWFRALGYNEGNIYRGSELQNGGFSVRCIKD